MNRTGFVLTLVILTMVISLPETFSISSSTRPNQTHIVVALESSSSKSQLGRAASYLISMYSPTLGLVANSEDRGPNPLGEEVGVPCCDTYWVYSDNLWSGWALQPFNPSIAENITDTVQRYTTKHGRSMLFEAAIGEPIPTTIHAKKDIKVFEGIVEGSLIQVLLDRHQFVDNPDVFHDAEEYADLCFYMTINYWMMGDIGASMHWFRIGERMWNLMGFYDKAARNDGRYQNFKLGLFVLAQRVTQFESKITEEVEVAAWGYQNDLGGITTESWLDGSPYGTANTETTSALLLAYNEQLINRLHKRQSKEKYELEVAKSKLEIAESKLEIAMKRISTLLANISSLEEEISVLRERPWISDPWPPWFTILLVSTVVLATTTSILAVWVRRLRSTKHAI